MDLRNKYKINMKLTRQVFFAMKRRGRQVLAGVFVCFLICDFAQI